MLNCDELDALSKELNRFIQDNLYIEEPDYKLRPHRDRTNPAKFFQDKENVHDFILKNKKESEYPPPFSTLLKKWSEQLYPKKKKDFSDLHNMALITKSRYYQLITNKSEPGKIVMLGLGFALINENLRQKNPLNKTPKEIMNELFISLRKNASFIRYDDPFDLVIIFCLEKIAIYECDITDVDYFLKTQELSWLSEKLLYKLPLDKKKIYIKSMLNQIKKNYLKYIGDLNFDTNTFEEKKKKMKKEIEKIYNEYDSYFSEKEDNTNNNIDSVDDNSNLPFIPVNAIYLPILQHAEHIDEHGKI